MDPTTVDEVATGVGTAVGRTMDELEARLKTEAHQLTGKTIGDVLAGGVDYLKDNPVKTVLISVAFGAVLGSIIRRRIG